MAPLISVLMPVRDGARWLEEALASIRAQTLSDYELVAVDDGSADDTPRLLELSALEDKRIRVIRQERAGLVTALNNGIAASRGRFIARFDSDDRALPLRLQRQADYLTAHPEVGLLGTWAEIIDESGRVNGRLEPPTSPAALETALVRGNPFVHPSVMFPKHILEKVGLFRPAFEAAEDYDLWLRIAEIAHVANLPECLLQYRVHGAGISGRARLRQLFSTRLAQHAAKARRAGEADLLSHLSEPPDWHDTGFGDSEEVRVLASLYRFLAMATEPTGTDMDGVNISILNDGRFVLSHAERRLAQIALLNMMRQHRSAKSDRIARAWQFVRLHPPRAMKLLFETLKGL